MSDDAKELGIEEGSVKAVLLQYAKSFNGYDYISASRIERIPEKGSDFSVLLNQIQYVYLTKAMNEMIIKNRGKKFSDAEAEAAQKKIEQDFMDAFGNGRLVFIQAHTSMPTQSKDGVYNSIDTNGVHIKSKLINQFTFESDDDAKRFVPTIIHRVKPGQYEFLEGNPFHDLTDAELAAVIAMTQPNAVKQPSE